MGCSVRCRYSLGVCVCVALPSGLVVGLSLIPCKEVHATLAKLASILVADEELADMLEKASSDLESKDTCIVDISFGGLFFGRYDEGTRVS